MRPWQRAAVGRSTEVLERLRSVCAAQTLEHLGGTLYRGTLPRAHCGETPEYYVSAQGDGGTTVTTPGDAPVSVYAAAVGETVTLFADDFENDLGWTAIDLGASTGHWQRGVPVNDPGWTYDPVSDADGSGRCYLTQNETGNTDIDGGAVQLESPAMDLSGGGLTISYDYYLYLTNTDGIDKLLVEIADSGGPTGWSEVARHDTNGGTSWRHHTITQAALDAAGVTLTTNTKLRFTANDEGTASINESGVDAFVITGDSCAAVGDGDFEPDGDVDLLDFAKFQNCYGADPAGPTCAEADLDGDGAVGPADLELFVFEQTQPQ